MEKISSKLYIKQYNRRLVTVAGAEMFVAGKYIPPYVVPAEYWLRYNLVGDGAGIAPDETQYMSIKCGLVETDTSQEQVETDDITGDEMIGRYGNAEMNRFGDDSDSVESGQGIPMDMQQRSSWWRAREVNWWRTRLGLPGKAVFNDASLILHTDSFRAHGKIKSPLSIDQPKFFFCAAETQLIDAETDWGDILFGGSLLPGTLMEDIYEQLGATARAVELAERANTGSALQEWLEAGFVTQSGASQDIWVEAQLTLRCDVYRPGATNLLTPF